MFQKITDPNLYGVTFHNVDLYRVKTNLVYLFYFGVLIFFIKNKVPKSHFEFIVLFIGLALLSLAFSLDIERSFYSIIVVIISPLLFQSLVLCNSVNIKLRGIANENKKLRR